MVSGSTPILLYLEKRHPDPALLPEEPQQRAECTVLMTWADATFMALTRRMAYFRVLSAPEQLGQMFFPGMAPAAQRIAGRGASLVLRQRFGIDAERNRRDEESVRRAARVAVEQLAGEEHLVGGSLSLADVTLAAMTAPMQYTSRDVREDPYVEALLRWGSRVLGADFTPLRPLTSAAVYQN